MTKLRFGLDLDGRHGEPPPTPPIRVTVGAIVVESHPEAPRTAAPGTPTRETPLLITSRTGVFGLGEHPSTRQLLGALQVHLFPGDRVLDLGTGTGILALAAARLGAGRVTAVDIDLRSIEAARDAVHENDLTPVIDLHHGTASDLAGLFDLVLTNLSASTLLPARGSIKELLSGGGLLMAAVPSLDRQLMGALSESFDLVAMIDGAPGTVEILDAGADAFLTEPAADGWLTMVLRRSERDPT